MAQAYWRSGRTAEATFSLHFRTMPPGRGHLVFSGLEDSLDFLQELRMQPADLEYLAGRGDFDRDFLGYLGNLRFSGSVRAMAEGTAFFPPEPVMEITAPVIEAQLAETNLINLVHLQTLLTTKASRVVSAAGAALVFDFGARRAHGRDAALKMARSGYIAGFSATSNVEAAALLGIHAAGTMAHSFITSFDSELEAFRAYARAFPDSATLLVDTYDTLGGVEAAIRVARESAELGGRVAAIRLDSGDLASLAACSRAMLDDAGLGDVRIIASGGLDEYSIHELASGGAPIDAYGVGTNVATPADGPTADCVYKMVAYDGRPVIKLSSGKSNLPGPKQVLRQVRDGTCAGDRIQAADEPMPGGGSWHPLLSERMRCGMRTCPPPALADIRRRVADGLGRLPESVRRLAGPGPYPVETSEALSALAVSMGAGRTGRNRGN